MDKVFHTKSLNPFEAEREVYEERIRVLNGEIIRLKAKCGEGFTSKELLEGFGDQPRMVHIGPPKS